MLSDALDLGPDGVITHTEAGGTAAWACTWNLFPPPFNLTVSSRSARNPAAAKLRGLCVCFALSIK